MKYEFDVGDYVETKDGDVGVVTKVNMLPCWYCTYGEGPRTKAQEYVIPVGTDVDMARVYNRIGQYDFTKKDEGKIKPLDYTERFIRNSTVDTTLISYMKKINELVNAVNELRAAQEGV